VESSEDNRLSGSVEASTGSDSTTRDATLDAMENQQRAMFAKALSNALVPLRRFKLDKGAVVCTSCHPPGFVTPGIYHYPNNLYDGVRWALRHALSKHTHLGLGALL